MDSSKTIDENIDEFIRLTLLLKETDQALDDSTKIVILLNFNSTKDQVVKNTLQYTGMILT